MKILIIIVGVLLAVGMMVVLYGDRLISSRFDLGTYSYVTSGPVAVTNEVVIRTGLAWALQQARLDTNAWIIPPSTSWWHNAGGNRVVITLNNQVDGMQLYAGVEPASNGMALKYNLYRGK